jgi:hypothetical protein
MRRKLPKEGFPITNKVHPATTYTVAASVAAGPEDLLLETHGLSGRKTVVSRRGMMAEPRNVSASKDPPHAKSQLAQLRLNC